MVSFSSFRCQKCRPARRRGWSLRWLAFTAVCISTGVAVAQPTHTTRAGKVLIIRGAFTVFSLGLDELAETLAHRGVDVTVSTAAMASSAAAKLGDAYRWTPTARPLVIIGHSRGGKLAPKIARDLQDQEIPVRLIVVMDTVFEMTLPKNVKRCVNLYHTNPIGVFHGRQFHAESRRTELVNINLSELGDRPHTGTINHFNIDESPWVHQRVIEEVLRVCPPLDYGTNSPLRISRAPRDRLPLLELDARRESTPSQWIRR